jgi:catechol 2,3-dioxygenase-like lactoylglutathione lyase family enzyme
VGVTRVGRLTARAPHDYRGRAIVITGAHTIIYSPEAERLRAFFAEVLGFPSVDAGHGWLIFALPPAELAIHPTDGGGHELFLMCNDLQETVQELERKGVEFSRPIQEERWGVVTAIRLPDGGEVGLYEPRHPLPPR